MQEQPLFQWIYDHLFWLMGIAGTLSLFFKQVRNAAKWLLHNGYRVIAPLHAPDELFELQQQVEIDAELAPIMRFDLAVDGRCTWISDSFLKTFHLREWDVADTNWENIIAAESYADVKARWARCFETGNKYDNNQYMVRGSGEKVYCHVRARAVKTKLGKVKSFRGIVEIIGE